MPLEPQSASIAGKLQLLFRRHLLAGRLILWLNFLVAQTNDGQLVGFGKSHQNGMLLAASHTPSGPYIQHPDLALHVMRPKLGRVDIQRVQRKCRGWFTHQRRWNFAWVAVQADG